jgi:tetratricopeptide (TPR) repeat protein
MGLFLIRRQEQNDLTAQTLCLQPPPPSLRGSIIDVRNANGKTMSRNYCSPRQLFSTLLLCAVAFLPIALARSDEPHWIRVNSSHFSVVTDADEKHGHDVAVRFEQMRAVFGQLLSRSRINMSEPIDIIALRNDEEYSKVVPTGQRPGIASGFFIPGEDRDYFVLNLSKDESWRSISRDLALFFLNYNYPPTQPWFDEGFAEYFLSLHLDKQVQIGSDPESFSELLNSSTWLTIPDLFAKGRENSPSAEKSRHTLFYAESWIVMHYLLAQNKLSETGTYLDLVENQKLPVEEAIRKAYGMSSAQSEQAVKDHFHVLLQTPGSAAGVQLNGVPLPENIGSSTQELPEAEGRALVAEMSLRIPEHREQAVQQLESIINLPKGDNVVARRGLAWAHVEKKEFDRAIEELNKGAELNPKDPWLHYYLALVRLRAAQSSRTSIQGLPNMMQDLHAVLDWDPEFAEARSMLAMAQLEGGGVHAAMDSMRPALLLSPRNQTYLLDMAEIYLAGKNWDAATALLERLKNSPDPQIAKSASEQLAGLPMLKKYGVLPQDQTSKETLPSTPSQSAPSGTPSSAKRNVESETQTKQSPKTDEEATEDQGPSMPAAPQIDKRPIKFVKGKLLAIDCTQSPSAILTVAVGAKVLKLRAPDYKAVTLIGADAFSCDWKSRAVAVNYRAGGTADGDLVSLEVQ